MKASYLVLTLFSLMLVIILLLYLPSLIELSYIRDLTWITLFILIADIALSLILALSKNKGEKPIKQKV
ncbi:MAG: hypothetical protein ACUVUS_08765 [Thermoproteota archaeon]